MRGPHKVLDRMSRDGVVEGTTALRSDTLATPIATHLWRWWQNFTIMYGPGMTNFGHDLRMDGILSSSYAFGNGRGKDKKLRNSKRRRGKHERLAPPGADGKIPTGKIERTSGHGMVRERNRMCFFALRSDEDTRCEPGLAWMGYGICSVSILVGWIAFTRIGCRGNFTTKKGHHGWDFGNDEMLPAFLALQQIDTRLVEHIFRARNEMACQKSTLFLVRSPCGVILNG